MKYIKTISENSIIIGCFMFALLGVINVVYFNNENDLLYTLETIGLLLFGICFVVRIYIWLFVELKEYTKWKKIN